MAMKIYDSDSIQAIATAIRAKDGDSTLMTVDEMPSRISAINTGGGSSIFVTGDFVTGTSTGASSITINYSGSGYPVACMVHVKNGAYNNTSGAGAATTAWYNTIQRYAVGQWTMHKAQYNTTPTYGTSGAANYGVTTAIYKNSTSSATSYTRTSAMNSNTFSSSNATNAALTCIRFKGNKTLSYYVNTSSYGLMPNTTYTYYIVYSS